MEQFAMEPFEYVVVITSLIIGLGIAQVLNGLADIVSGFKHLKVSVAHVLMIISTFLNLYQDWFYNYEYSVHVEEWTMKVILGLLTFPILVFILARMLIPTGLRSDEKDLVAYYNEQWPSFFIISIWIVLISIFQDIHISGIPISEQIPKIVLIATYSAFLIFKIQNRWAHIIFQALFLIGMITFILVTDIPLIQSIQKAKTQEIKQENQKPAIDALQSIVNKH